MDAAVGLVGVAAAVAAAVHGAAVLHLTHIIEFQSRPMAPK